MDASTLPAAAPSPAPFDLTRRFSVLSLACVLAVAAVLGQALARMLSDRLLHREAVVTMEFVQSLVRADVDAAGGFDLSRAAAIGGPLEDTFRHFASMPDVLRANVHSTDRRMIWSSDATLIGRQFGANEDLDAALAGRLVYKSGEVRKEEHKADARVLEAGGGFIEIYVPLLDKEGRVVAAAELYKTPTALFEAIRDGRRGVYLGAAVGSVFLYAALIGIVRRADAIMRDQQRRLVENERLATVGEMAAAVAHAIRNPLASIRTSVELALDRDPGNFAEPADDIVAEVDKVEAWVRDLLAFSGPGSVRRESLDVNELARKSASMAEKESSRRAVRVSLALADPPPTALGDPAVIEQVLHTLVSNALDAMPQGGQLGIATRARGGGAEIEVRDSGIGMRPEEVQKAFIPFFTTKARGTGLGLPLARRMLERMGGSITLASRPGEGTSARIVLPAGS